MKEITEILVLAKNWIAETIKEEQTDDEQPQNYSWLAWDGEIR